MCTSYKEIKLINILNDLNKARKLKYTLYEYYLIDSLCKSEQQWQKYMKDKISNMTKTAYLLFIIINTIDNIKLN